MKKLISMLLAVATSFTCMASIASAAYTSTDGYEFAIVEDKDASTDTSLVLKLQLKSATDKIKAINGFYLELDCSEIIDQISNLNKFKASSSIVGADSKTVLANITKDEKILKMTFAGSNAAPMCVEGNADGEDVESDGTIVTIKVPLKAKLENQYTLKMVEANPTSAPVSLTYSSTFDEDAWTYADFKKVTPTLASITVGESSTPVFAPAAGGNMVNPANGKTEKTYLTDIVKFNTDGTAPTITIKDEAGDTRTFEGDWYPTNLKGQGTINVLVIVRYAGETEKTFSIVNE